MQRPAYVEQEEENGVAAGAGGSGSEGDQLPSLPPPAQREPHADEPQAVWREEEMTVDDDENDADMRALMKRGMPEGVARDYINVYELFLIHGASAGDARKKVTELFSPPRVTAEIQRLPIINLVVGSTFDLRMDAQGRSWNFLLTDDRARARKQIEAEKPFLVVGSPPCTYYSVLTQSNYSRMDPRKVERRKAEAKVLLEFAMEIYELQLKAGRHFLHEHPQSASSWQDTRMMKMMAHPRVDSVVAHLCQYGMKTMGDDGSWQPAKKATRFASSSEEVLKKLDRKCNGEHAHRHLTSGRAKHAAVYPPELCKAILRGIEKQRLREGAKVSSYAEEQVE